MNGFAFFIYFPPDLSLFYYFEDVSLTDHPAVNSILLLITTINSSLILTIKNMKSVLSFLSDSHLKPAIILICSFVGFAGINPCKAQSIVGKWMQNKIKTIYTAEGAKKYGAPESEINISTLGVAEFEFKSDHTYVMNTSTLANASVRTFLGTWSLAGNQLEMKLDPQQPDSKDNPKKGTPVEKTTLTVNGNKMEWTTNYSSNNLISKIIITFDRK